MKWQMCVLTCALACALERLETLCKLQKVGTPLGLLCRGSRGRSLYSLQEECQKAPQRWQPGALLMRTWDFDSQKAGSQGKEASRPQDGCDWRPERSQSC